jgi:transcriptional regulator with XRE-family HTH domain
MAYTAEEIANTLKAAREARGLSQRTLGGAVGLPQSHVSKIEGGAVDLKLSSLIELARALDLDVVLVPRKFVPAVQSIIRSAEPVNQAATEDRAVKEVRLLQKAVAATRELHPDIQELRRLQDTARDLTNIRLSEPELSQVHEARLLIKRAAAGKAALDDILPLSDTLRQMRNRLVHNPSEPPPRRPAYSLDNGDANA